ncbi:MAG: dihydrodipicolinate reductase C-terminal domain-containing protein, partial [Dokdonella sp.]
SDRNGKRADGATGYAVVRGGDVVGEHSVLFLGEGERLEFVHRATDRDIFARGALAAGIWIARQPPGVHTLDAVLGLEPSE